tara:strand:+ start:39 stop:257 length:219 start_codon:yes stop_codon:yes gene_type:complete
MKRILLTLMAMIVFSACSAEVIPTPTPEPVVEEKYLNLSKFVTMEISTLLRIFLMLALKNIRNITYQSSLVL